MIQIYIGFFLDYFLGDPKFLPHPVIYIGKFIDFTEKKIYNLNINKKLLGFMILILISILSFLTVFFVLYFLESVNYILKIAVEAFIIFQILAIKGLKDEPLKVYNHLKNENIDKARDELSMLVTRDTDKMDEEEIIRSTIETVAENIIDAIISPLFYIFIGGAALGMFYKAVNTLDSMVGYKNDKYLEFGYFSAKLDDILNFIPARITSFLIIAAAFILKYDYTKAFKVLMSDYRKTSSPNSGCSEAPIAGALDIYFGGQTTYFGKKKMKPIIGYGEDFKIEKIKDSIKIMQVTALIGLLLFTIVVMI